MRWKNAEKLIFLSREEIWLFCRVSGQAEAEKCMRSLLDSVCMNILSVDNTGQRVYFIQMKNICTFGYTKNIFGKYESVKT